MHGTHRSIFVGGRPAKVDHEAIAEVLRHIAVPGLHRRHRRLLVGTHHGAVVFGIEVLGQLRRVDQVAEQHRDLAAFGLRGVAHRVGEAGRSVGWRRSRCGLGCECLGRRWKRYGSLYRRGLDHSRRRRRQSLTGPDEHLPALVNGHALGDDEFLLQPLDERIVEAKFLLERPVAHPPLALQQGHHQGEYAIYPHPCLSLLSRSRSRCGV